MWKDGGGVGEGEGGGGGGGVFQYFLGTVAGRKMDIISTSTYRSWVCKLGKKNFKKKGKGYQILIYLCYERRRARRRARRRTGNAFTFPHF